MKRRSILIFILLSLVIASCQKININYIGETFPKTSYAKIFFSKKEVERPFEIMGKAIVSASTSFSVLEIQNKLRRTAEAKGADALIIISYKEVPAGMYAYNNYPMCGMYDGMYGWGGMGCMGCMYPNNFAPYWGDMYYGGWGMGEESVQCYYNYLIRVLFIRYIGDENTADNSKAEIYLNGKPVKIITKSKK